MRKVFLIIVSLLIALTAVNFASAQTENRQVYAYYFGWWTSDSWNNSRLIDKPAQLYDSRDAGTIGRQIDQAKSAGIDAFIMSWYGPKNGNLTSQVFNMLLDQASARGFKAAASVDMADANYNSTSAEVLDSLRYLIGDRANHPAYLRYAGKPVIYFWNEGRFGLGQYPRAGRSRSQHHLGDGRHEHRLFAGLRRPVSIQHRLVGQPGGDSSVVVRQHTRGGRLVLYADRPARLG